MPHQANIDMSRSDREKEITRVTLIGSVGNFLLLAFKFIAGVIGHSGAMIADAVHSLSDFVTDIIVLVFVRVSSKPKDPDHDYGHGKYETLSTAIIGIMLMCIGLGIFWDSLVKIYNFYFRHKSLESPGEIALIAALVSIVVKELLYRLTVHVGKKVKSQTVVANAWHHRSDALSSIGTAVGIGGAILLGAKWRVLDPIAAMLVSVLIVRVGIELFVPAVNDLLEKSLPAKVEEEILQLVRQIPEVRDPHNLCTRNIGNDIAIELHIRVDGDSTVSHAHDITRQIEISLRHRFGPATHISLHVEPVK